MSKRRISEWFFFSLRYEYSRIVLQKLSNFVVFQSRLAKIYSKNPEPTNILMTDPPAFQTKRLRSHAAASGYIPLLILQMSWSPPSKSKRKVITPPNVGVFPSHVMARRPSRGPQLIIMNPVPEPGQSKNPTAPVRILISRILFAKQYFHVCASLFAHLTLSSESAMMPIGILMPN